MPGSRNSKVLILGASGMLGLDLAEVFKSHALTTWSSADIDITNQPAVFEKLKESKPALVINSAANSDLDEGEKDKPKIMQINAEAPKYLAAACQELGATLVHYSTDYVFNGHKEKGYTEADELGPVNVYGESKALSEKYIKESGLKSFYIIRTSWLFSKNKQSSKPRGTNFVNNMIELARKGEPVKALSYRKSNPTYTPDLAQATRQLIDEKYEPGIYHIVNEGCTTPYLMTNEIFDIMKRAGLVDALPELTEVKDADGELGVPRPQYSCLINTKFPKLRAWQEALEEYIKSLTQKAL